MRETVPRIIKNAPKEGTVPHCVDVTCTYSSGRIITHTDSPRHMRKMTRTATQQVRCVEIHAEVKTNNEHTRIQ